MFGVEIDLNKRHLCMSVKASEYLSTISCERVVCIILSSMWLEIMLTYTAKFQKKISYFKRLLS